MCLDISTGVFPFFIKETICCNCGYFLSNMLLPLSHFPSTTIVRFELAEFE
jgi:hypothetical protein